MQRTKDGRIVFSPSDLTRFFESEFASWMDRYQKFHTEDGSLDGFHRNPKDPLEDLLAAKGNSHEEDVCNLFGAGGKITKMSRDGERDILIQKTLEVMKSGAPVIYQAALFNGHLFGYADLLERRDGNSKLGQHYYVPIDVKISSLPKPTAIIQLCAYAEKLEHVQGKLPEEISVITRDKVRHRFRTDAFYHFYLYFKRRFLEFHNIYSKETQPLPLKNGEHRDWSIYAKKVLHQRDDIALTARIRQSQIECFRESGITTLTQLANNKKKNIKGIPEVTLDVLTNQARLQVASRGKRPPLYEVNPHPEGLRMGLAMLPDPHPKDVFFDMEGYPLLGKNGLEYLYGVSERGKNYLEFWAHLPSQEGNAFKKFVEWVFARWKQNPGMHIYHFAQYEPSTLKRLMGTYGICESMIGDLLKNEVFVDLYAVVTQGIQVGTHSYGLKAIEALYYPERETEVSSGAESAVEFARWLDSGDHSKPEKSPFLERIRKYNQDDCWSTHDLEIFLQGVKKSKRIAYVPMHDEIYEEDEDSLKSQSSKFAEEMIAKIPVEERGKPFSEAKPEHYVCELLAHSLEFHRREDRPDWWQYFSRRDMTRDDLARDPDALVGVRIEKNGGDLFYCTFQTEQDTKYRAGDEVLILENQEPFERLEIVEWDLLRGRLTLKGKPTSIPEGEFTLAAAHSFIRKDALRKALLRHAQAFKQDGKFCGLKKHIFELLLRKTPDINGRKPSEALIRQDDDRLDQISIVVLNMNQSVLCIQGPPGTGKTHTASHVIAAVLKKGKKVAVSSNSHKAINHLLIKVNEVAGKKREVVRAVKVTSNDYYDDEKVLLDPHGIALKKSSTKPEQILGLAPNLLGATVYYLSKPELDDKFDYLFIDEATQVALPNLLSMAHCAKNVVLLGDQNQLEQPTKAVHPGDSGLSALVHLTQGKATVPPDFGIFLPVTHRMHPEVCKVVSEAFYEGALSSEPSTRNHQVVWGGSEKEPLSPSGVQFIPVPHKGNKHGSKEEVDRIEQLVKCALGSHWVDKKGEKSKIGWEDILLVAPYNYQVALLQDRLGSKARVGSVDLFQGQEAPVVIVSLCASSGAEAPRGLGFLLNKNRLNVAISRAKCVALLVGSPSLGESNASTLATMQLLNAFYRISGGNKG